MERALDELYATPPPGFVSRREELALQARSDGRVADGRRIHAARRPSLAAWTANLLLRSRPEESRRFMELGRALREAYQNLDAGGVRELSEQRRSLVAALSRQAGELAREAGHPLSDTVRRDVESTLLAVLADQDAADQWATGRLESVLVPPTAFPSRTTATDGTPREPASPPRAGEPPRAKAPRAKEPRAKDEVAERRRRKQELLGQAREAAKAADQRLRDLSATRAEADAELEQAHARHDRAAQEVSEAEQHLRRAREDLQRAADQREQAERRLRSATEAAAEAERAARQAAKEVERHSRSVT
ncbi:hypothetical protein ACWD26_10720 [Streptomyces sp. NPDC002787]